MIARVPAFLLFFRLDLAAVDHFKLRGIAHFTWFPIGAADLLNLPAPQVAMHVACGLVVL
jgi:hypothetical protein